MLRGRSGRPKRKAQNLGRASSKPAVSAFWLPNMEATYLTLYITTPTRTTRARVARSLLRAMAGDNSGSAGRNPQASHPRFRVLPCDFGRFTIDGIVLRHLLLLVVAA